MITSSFSRSSLTLFHFITASHWPLVENIKYKQKTKKLNEIIENVFTVWYRQNSFLFWDGLIVDLYNITMYRETMIQNLIHKIILG